MATPNFDEIEHLVRAGHHRQAKSAIGKLKKAGLNAETRLKCSDWYLRIGFPNEAIKIIGSELLETELKFADVHALKLQARLAYMLGYFGAAKSAERVSKKLEPYLHKDRDFAAQFFRFRGGNAMRVYDYSLAAESYRRSLEFLDPQKDFYLIQMMRLGYSDGLEGIGKTNEAVQIATQVLQSAKEDQVILKAIAHQARGEYHFKAENYKAAKSDFDQSWKLFPKDVTSRDYGFLAKWSGALEWTLGRKEEAERQLNLALKILSKDRLRPTNVLEVIFWLTRLFRKKIARGYSVLNTHPSQSPFSYLTGRRCEDPKGLHPWIAKRLEKPSQADTWFLHNGGIAAREYSRMAEKSEEGTLDLVSGLVYGKHKNEVLTELKTKCLLALVSASNLGLSDWALIDYVYSGEWQIPQSMMLRLNDLIKQLRGQGFKVLRKNNQFFWSPPKNQKVLMPMDHRLSDISRHLRIRKPEFRRIDIENLYGIKAPTAKVWIKVWLQKGLIMAVYRGRKALYRFQ